MHEFGLVGRRHDHEVRQAAEIGEVERARVRRPVGADEAGAVDGEAHRQALDRDVVDDLIVSALQERGVERAEGLQALGGEAGGEGDGVLLGDADVERALGELPAEEVEPGAVRHGGGDGDDALVLAGFRDQAVGEDPGEGRRVLLGLHLSAGDDVEARHAMILVVRFLGRRVPLAFLGDDVDEDRALPRVPHVLQNRQKLIEIVPVDGADVVEAELLEPHAALPEVARVFLHASGAPLPALRQALGELLGEIAQMQVGAARRDTGEIRRERAGRRRDRHIVVVQDDDQALVAGARIVDRLVGHAGAHGAVANDGDDVVLGAVEIARDRHAEAGRDRCRGMGGAERVVFALGALGETREAAALAQRADAVAPAGQDLVRVGLVADVPDQPVARRVEHPVQRHRQLDDAEARAQMAARHRDGLDGLEAQLVGDLAQLRFRVRAQILGCLDGVEERGLAHGGASSFQHRRSRRRADRGAPSELRLSTSQPRRTPDPFLPEHFSAERATEEGPRPGKSSRSRCGTKIGGSAVYSGSRGSMPRGAPSAPTVSFSTRASASFSRRSQCPRRASPRS